MKWERISIWMVTKATRLDEIEEVCGLSPSTHDHLEDKEMRKNQPRDWNGAACKAGRNEERECRQIKWRQCLHLEVLIHMLSHRRDVRWQEDWEWTLGFGKVEVVAILKRGFSRYQGEESSVEWSSREDGKREDLENRCLVKKGFYCKGTEENGWRAFACFFLMCEKVKQFFLLLFGMIF